MWTRAWLVLVAVVVPSMAVADCPSLDVIQRRAEAFAGLDHAPRWGARARWSAVVPVISARATTDTSWEEGSAASRAAVGPVERQQAFDVRLTWRLERLVFTRPGSKGAMMVEPAEGELAPRRSWTWTTKVFRESSELLRVEVVDMHGVPIRVAEQPVVVANPTREAAMAACKACHGTWGIQGLVYREACNCAARDAGQECRDGDACEGRCVFERWEVSTPAQPLRCRGKTCAARVAGIGLAQVGEFSFILASSAVALGIMSQPSYQLFLGASVITMLVAPFAVSAAPDIADRVFTLRQHVDYVRSQGDDLGATITTHHLIINRNHILVGGIKPHYYCLPVAKRESHRLSYANWCDARNLGVALPEATPLLQAWQPAQADRNSDLPRQSNVLVGEPLLVGAFGLFLLARARRAATA